MTNTPKAMKLNNIIDRLRLPFRKEKELYVALHDIMGFYPREISYYKQALMHKSVGRRNEKGKPLNNERLEFLGDAILDAVVGHIVYDHFAGKREGFLTNTRSKLVSRDTLGKLAKEMGLTRLILSSGQSQSHNSYMAGNAFEALVGAIYLDRGYDDCMRFMEKRILAQMINIDKVAYKEVNFKSKLLEWSQKNRVRLEYRMLKQEKDQESGSPVFRFQVVLEGVEGECGEGFSKKEAQQLASKETLQRLRREPQYIDSIFAAKTARTQMEEMPAMAVPDIEQKQEFIISSGRFDDAEAAPAAPADKPAAPAKRRGSRRPKADADATGNPAQATGRPAKGDDKSDQTADEFSLDDISAVPKEKSREDIIAEAESAAYSAD